MKNNKRIAIIGAGIAGLTAAIYLRRMGMEIDVFERASHFSPAGSGLLIQPSGLYVLDDIAVLPTCLAKGTPIKGILGTSPLGEKTILDTRYEHWKANAHGLGIRRDVLLNILYRAALRRGVKVHLNHDVADYQSELHCVRLEFKNRAPSESYDALIVANGRNSMLPSKIPVMQSKRPYKWGAAWATIELPENYDAAFLRQWYRGSHEMFGILPVGKSLHSNKEYCSLFWSLPNALTFSEFSSNLGLEKWKSVVRNLAGNAINPFLDQIKRPDQISVVSYTDIQMEQWHDHRVLAIGDCAHAMSPQLGQGANMALVDASELYYILWNLKENIPQAFETYSKCRKNHLRYYQFASRWLTPLFQSSCPLAPLVRDMVMRTAQRFDFAKKQAATTLVGGRERWRKMESEWGIRLLHWDGKKPARGPE